jgi:hypothetical protein
MSKYRKVETRIWDDEKFRAWSRDEKLLFLFLLTHREMTAIGAMRALWPGLAEEIGYPIDTLRDTLSRLSRYGSVEGSERDRIIILPNFLKYNPPENPKVCVHMGSCFESLPDCELKCKHLKRIRDTLDTLPKGYREGLETHLIPVRYPEPRPEPEPEPEPQPQPGENVSAPPAPPLEKTPPAFDSWWTLYPKKRGKGDALSAWKARVKEGVSADDLTAALKNYLEEIRIRGTEDTYVKNGATFLGKRKGYEDFLPGKWTPPSTGALHALHELTPEEARQEADAFNALSRRPANG